MSIRLQGNKMLNGVKCPTNKEEASNYAYAQWECKTLSLSKDEQDQFLKFIHIHP